FRIELLRKRRGRSEDRVVRRGLVRETCRRQCHYDAGAREFCRRVDQSCVGDGGVGTGVVALGEAEVENFRIATRSDEDVGGLDVAMDDALRVSGGEGVYDLDGPFKKL